VSDFQEVTTAEAVELAKSGTYLIDVREQDEWNTGHAAGAHFIPMSMFGERMADIPAGEKLLVICQSGGRSARVAQALTAAGYDAVNVAGGTGAWASAGGTIVVD